MKIKIHQLLCASFLIFLFACAGGGGELAPVGKDLALKITGSRSFNPDIVHGQIDYYTVSITADDLKIPFTKKFDGNTAAANMTGIPAGSNRTILVEAINPNGLVIRRGKKEGVVIDPGQISNVDIVMVSVPIFTNIANKAAVSGNRVAFEVFAEPDASLQILKEEGDEDQVVVTEKEKEGPESAWLESVDIAGLYSLKPKYFDLGTHVFKVQDMSTGEFSKIEVTLFGETTRPGIAINSGGNAVIRGEDLLFSGMGQSYFRASSAVDQDNTSPTTLLEVVEMIY